MNRKISKLLQPGVEMYFIILILFALASALFSLPLAVLEAVVVLILGLYTRTSGHSAAGRSPSTLKISPAMWT